MMFSIAPVGLARDLDFEARVAAQRAIENVYWNHRTWPKENRTGKPPLSTVMPDETIRAKVEDYLKQSNALATWWQRPITAAQLQGEMDRMAKSTRDGEMLRELYRALGDDPFVIAETLARQTLVERLIRNWYASDDRFHGKVKRNAQRTLAGARSVADMKQWGEEYLERTFVRRGIDEGAREAAHADAAIELSDAEWTEWTDDLARQLGAGREAMPVRRLGALQETQDQFFVVALLSREADRAVVASVAWPKRSFDAWWSTERARTSAEVRPEAHAYQLLAPRAGGCVEDTWESRVSVAQGASSHSAVWTGTEMIVWGGASTLGFLNTGGRYNPTTDSWTATSTGPNVPAERDGHTAVWTGTEMIVWGGRNIDGFHYPNTGGRYNPTTDSWTATSTGAHVPSARAGSTAVWTGTEMIVWGGYYYDGAEHSLKTGGRYDPTTDTWAETSTGPDVPAERSGHTAVWTGTEMIVWGGFQYGVGWPVTGGRYDPSSDSWTATSTGLNVPAGRSGHTAVWTGAEMIVWGGDINGDSLNTGGRYDPTTDAWTATSTGANVPVGRRVHTAIWTGAEMIVWGGFRANDGYTNTGGRYDPSGDSWTATSLGANEPAARGWHTAVWTGTEMIVWGGSSPSDALDSGGRYVPSSDSWTATAREPEPRFGQSAVWTGTEMIVWGGFFLHTGGRYNPATDAWAPTSTGANVPAGRIDHTAVWTGTEMIVWGGTANDYVSLNTGGRYDPSTDRWTATSTGPDVPSARSDHTAVWTGTEMIIWGGGPYNSASWFSTGGRYDPITDRWTATSTGSNLPEARSDHTAVWTGTEMIVWGGFGGVGPLNTGGRYDPTTDSWRATSIDAGVPEARSRHTAVWTGTEVIVWGGFGDHGFDSGGRYDPRSDSWAATSTGANVPDARYAHTAVWTGTEMIIWGGSEFGSTGPYWNSGGRYDPVSDSWAATSTGANVPAARSDLTAVWTGTELIVWGGNPFARNVYLYCAPGCAIPFTVWRDRDGDRYGDPVQPADSLTCAIPAGFAANAEDCNDQDSAIHPGFPERCNGLDDDCDAVVDNGGDALCSDANACTTVDACSGGACVRGFANMDSTAFSRDRVDGRDLFVLATAWGSCPADASRYNAAANLDRVTTLPGVCIGDTDFHLFMDAFGRTCPPESSPAPRDEPFRWSRTG